MSMSTISLYRGPASGGGCFGSGESVSDGIDGEVASMVSLSGAVGYGTLGLSHESIRRLKREVPVNDALLGCRLDRPKALMANQDLRETF